MLSVGFSLLLLLLLLLLCQLVLGRGWWGEARSPVCGFVFSLVMAFASARLPHCYATSLPITSFNCNMRWLLRLECCFCPTGPLGFCVRAAAQLLPCYCNSWPRWRWLLDFVCSPYLCVHPLPNLSASSACSHMPTSDVSMCRPLRCACMLSRESLVEL